MPRFAIWLFVLLIVPKAAFSAPRPKHKIHTIQSGDTPAGLSKRYGVTYEEIVRFNNRKPDEVLRVGDKLEIPFEGEVTGDEYTVKAGDSLARIADFFGLAQDDLRTANGLKKSENVKIGQKLKIPHELRAGAADGHVVRKGDTLASVAKRYSVPVKALAAANKLKKDAPLALGRTLIIPEDDTDVSAEYRPRKSAMIVSGRKVAGGVKHTVQDGQSLWIIARAYNVAGDKIAKANGIDKTKPLSTGDEILIPRASAPVPVRVKGYTVQPIHFVALWNNRAETLKLISNAGKINPRSRKIISEMSGERINAGKSKKGKPVKLLHPRLIHMLQRVAERYPGKTLELVSGYRPRKEGKRESMHNLGRAIDFRVKGVDRKELFNFIKELPKAGAGYYPNSVFVHMDTRDRSTFWVDFSGIGESPRYAKSGAPEIDPDARAEAEADQE